jgi:hypothetical protein
MSRVRGWYWVTAVKAYTLVPEMFAQGQGEEKRNVWVCITNVKIDIGLRLISVDM